jgi:hypothetical protein
MIESVAIILYLISFGILVASVFFSSDEAIRNGIGIPELPSKNDLNQLLNRANNPNKTVVDDFISGLRLLTIIVTGEDLKYIINQITNYELLGLFVNGAYIISTLFLAFRIITGRFL